MANLIRFNNIPIKSGNHHWTSGEFPGTSRLWRRRRRGRGRRVRADHRANPDPAPGRPAL